jgi:ParB family chromosome partitioning protein
VTFDDVDRMLAEIDENLIRNDLSDLERSEHLAERKRLYLVKHPETKQGGDRRSDAAKSNRNDFVSFATDTAEKIGRTPRSVRQDVQIAESIPEDVRDAIRDTPLVDPNTDLVAMVRRPNPT